MKLSLFLASIICVLALNWFDLDVLGPGLTLTLIYLIPIAIVSWFSGIYYGIAVGLLCSFAWLDIYIIHHGDVLLLNNLVITNISVKFAVYISYAILTGMLAETLRNEKAISRIDNLTGLVNSRAFLDALDKEIDRSTRYERVVSMIYMDIDNFKTVNDSYGHTTGDKALKETSKVLNSVFRTSDTIARMGGDEFAVLLPETNNLSSMAVATKLRDSFKIMSDIHQWPITLSIGVATFTTPPKDSDAIIKLADDLMYIAKKNGKNSIKTGTTIKW
jgi:diguanylate cyclase (GGDEF)-like protein